MFDSNFDRGKTFTWPFPDGLNEFATNNENDNVSSSFKDTVIQQFTFILSVFSSSNCDWHSYGITSVSLLPVETIPELSLTFFMGLLKALVPSVSMNIYVVGLNQLFDAEIDKSFAMGIMFQSPPHLAALLISFVLGSVYSIELPLLRWKKQAFLAATCIMIVRAIVVQLAFLVHMHLPSCVSFPSVVALFKHLSASNLQPEMNWIGHNRGYVDIPDVDGDRDYGIHLSVLWLCVNMLLIAYGAAVVVGASSIFLPSKFITGSTSALKSPPANAKPLINHSLPKLPKVVKVEEQVECLFRLSIAKETEIA
ncbi:hypothetical protein POTOM_024298 [Populus tomentosa]|uniref:Uncharacterized protein n=1 Tax=Populus tomentosa TaxID=118781 RepID=A0A8X7ZRQ4_POPTO|nr:hypothetical protein POTOM_024298 [Populus tomentosa]